MSTIDDGGPVHPGMTYSRAGAERGPHMGMSLRDWFAGQALRAQWGDGTAMTPEEAAELAYQVADAFIAARKGGTDA